MDPRPNLQRALAAVEAHAPQAILFSGDLSDDGSAESYAELRRMVTPVAERLGAVVIWGNGNHDARAPFRSILQPFPAPDGGSWPLIPEPHPLITEPHPPFPEPHPPFPEPHPPFPEPHPPFPEPDEGPLNHAHDLNGLRVLWLDTTVPGSDHGEVSPESLAWLAGQLAEPAPAGTILGMHHAPLPVVQDMAASWELLAQPALAEVLTGSDVRAILAGHYHQSGFGTFAGVPVHAATSLCYTQDLASGRGIRGQDGAQGWHLVRVHAHTVTSTVAPIGHHPTVARTRSAAESTSELAARGIQIADS